MGRLFIKNERKGLESGIRNGGDTVFGIVTTNGRHPQPVRIIVCINSATTTTRDLNSSQPNHHGKKK
jgi:hypothetical protein